MSDTDIAVADSLKVLDLKRPIREADVEVTASDVRFGPRTDMASYSITFRWLREADCGTAFETLM